MGEDFPSDGKLKLVVKPLKLKNGAVYRFERVKAIAKMSLDYVTWDNRLLRFGVEVSPKATIGEIVAEAQKRQRNNWRMHLDMYCTRKEGLQSPHGLKRSMS
jgi:hypothetical protein